MGIPACGDTMFLEKTNFSFPIQEIKPLIQDITWDNKNRCNLNYKTGNWLYDEYKICDCWKNTKIEELLETIPYDIGEARLMKLDPGLCYRSHADADDRLHINIQSNPYSYLIDLDNNEMYNLTEDNYLYYMDGSYIHTAANFGSTPRIQLVIRVKLERHNLKDERKVVFEFTDPPVNLRYLIDQSISPLINKMCKTGEIGFFDLLSEDKLYLVIERTALIKIQQSLDRYNVSYRIFDHKI